MFRIHVHREIESTSLTIEGKLMRPFVAELEKCWRAEIIAEPVNRIVVNLATVSFVDADGKSLLTQMRRQGATLVAKGCLMRAIVQDIEAGLSKEALVSQAR
jgi:ABC-type transporter Mla MlaB component